MIRQVQANPKMIAADLTKFANKQMGVSIGLHTLRYRLKDANLFAKRARS